MSTLATIFALTPFYLCGAFPTGRLIARRYGVDISQAGSGNVGATNVARTAGKTAGLLTLLGDVFKGWLAVWLAGAVSSDPRFSAMAGLAAVAGHCFSIPGKSRGGKGVATALGVISQLSPEVAAVSLAVFASVLAIYHYVSLASVTAAVTAPLVTLFSGTPESISLCITAISLIVALRHKDNLMRLSTGREPRFSFAHTTPPAKEDSAISHKETGR